MAVKLIDHEGFLFVHTNIPTCALFYEIRKPIK